MTLDDKTRLIEMRANGHSYTEIAEALGIPRNTIKTFCRRNGMTSEQTDKKPIETERRETEILCQNCGKPVTQNPGRKLKKFCSATCRTHWWNTHMDLVNRKAMYDYTCPTCGTTFTAYGNAHRKYCCHECYIEDRFGGAHGR